MKFSEFFIFLKVINLQAIFEVLNDDFSPWKPMRTNFTEADCLCISNKRDKRRYLSTHNFDLGNKIFQKLIERFL
jgi:hypothetical protein